MVKGSDLDIISTIEFDKTGYHLAKEIARVVWFCLKELQDEVNLRVLEGEDCSSSPHHEFHYKTVFQSHEPEFDYLTSLEAWKLRTKSTRSDGVRRVTTLSFFHPQTIKP